MTADEMRVGPGQLTSAAAEMSSATQDDVQAQRFFAQASAPPASVFGISPQARALAQQWADAATARAVDAHTLAVRTSQMAMNLNEVANSYGQTESGNTSALGSAGAALQG